MAPTAPSGRFRRLASDALVLPIPVADPSMPVQAGIARGAELGLGSKQRIETFFRLVLVARISGRRAEELVPLVEVVGAVVSHGRKITNYELRITNQVRWTGSKFAS